jgi:hypothetical protein
MRFRPAAAAVLVLAAAALPLGGCVESEMKVGVRADGSGSFRATNKFTEKAAQAIWKLKAADPDGEFAKELDKNMFRAPDEEGRKALSAKGIKVTEAEFKMEEKALSSKLGVDFLRVGAFEHLTDMKGVLAEGQAMQLLLTREKDGVYAFSLKVSGGTGGAGAGGDDAEEYGDEVGDDAEEDPEKQAAAMTALGELMGEASAFKARFVLEVPGTVVDFRPATAGKKEDGRVTWELDMSSMMTMSMEIAQEMRKEDADPGAEPGTMAFTVRFKPAEGVAIPDDALWSGRPKADAKPAPKDGTPPGEPKPPAPETPPGPAPVPPAPEPPKDGGE